VGCRDGEDGLSKEEGEELVSCCYLCCGFFRLHSRVSSLDLLRDSVFRHGKNGGKARKLSALFSEGDDGTQNREPSTAVSTAFPLSAFSLTSSRKPSPSPRLSAPSQQSLPFLYSPNLAMPFPTLYSTPFLDLCHRSSTKRGAVSTDEKPQSAGTLFQL
jgi:hypothetical protein